jgi:hypothetical protein
MALVTTRVNVSIPIELYRRMVAARKAGRRVNWSRLAAEAFAAALGTPELAAVGKKQAILRRIEALEAVVFSGGPAAAR